MTASDWGERVVEPSVIEPEAFGAEGEDAPAVPIQHIDDAYDPRNWRPVAPGGNMAHLPGMDGGGSK